MHEMSLVRNVVDMVLEECEGRGVQEVLLVHLTIGELGDVVEAYVPDLFRYLARGTVAENAEVVIERVPVRVRCIDCGEIFPIDTRDEATWSCPRCGAHQRYALFSGNEFRIDTIKVRATSAA